MSPEAVIRLGLETASRTQLPLAKRATRQGQRPFASPYGRYRTEPRAHRHYPFRVLHDFLAKNQQELIKRCARKSAKRDRARVTRLATPLTEPDHGVPAFLQQLIKALRLEDANPGAKGRETSGSYKDSREESHRSATLHGKALLKDGYTVDQVVHGYGDVCQSITELANEVHEQVTVPEFHTLNRLLDDAIADAVSSYAQDRDSDSADGAANLHERIGTLADELRLHVNVALKAMNALKVGNVGANGATGTLVHVSLLNLRDLIDKSLPEIRMDSGMTVQPKLGSGSK
jgi:hypothetical protein